MVRILIIDDEEPFRTRLRQLLAQWGHEVEEADNGAEGLAHYRTAPTDLIITDIIMPGQEGLETIKVLRRELQARAILAVTGSEVAALDLLDLAQEMGAHRTLTKPSSWRTLQPLVWPELQHAIEELLAPLCGDNT